MLMISTFFRRCERFSILFGDGFKCFACSNRNMERKAKVSVLLYLLLASLWPMSAQAYSSGGVESNEIQMSLEPESPVMGGSVDIEVILSNTLSVDAFGVVVTIYKDSVSSGNELYFNTIDIVADGFATVSATWSGLTEGDHNVWFEWSANSDTKARFKKSFTVQGMPNLRIDTLELNTASIVYQGDNVGLATLVKNSGSVDADASKLLVQVPESADRLLDTPALAAGASAWVNTTFLAPPSGIHHIDITPDAENVIQEASEMNKKASVELVVSTRMDLSFKGGLSVTTAPGALDGPWTVQGTLVRTNGTGSASIPLWLQLTSPVGGLITSPPFTVSFTGVGYSEQAFTFTLNSTTLSALPTGDHIVSAKINPFNVAGLEQEDTTNDMTSGVLTIFPKPDVYLDAIALPSVPSVQGGEDVEWRVTMENTGDIGVSGFIQYTFDGLSGQSPPILLDAGEGFTWTISLSTGLGAHQADFEAQWVAAQGSWDSNKLNSFATGTVLVESKLKLAWELASIELLDAEGNPVELPLRDGEAYTFSIGMTSENTGEANYTCQDSSNMVLDTINVNVATRGQRVSLSCSFLASASLTTIRLIPEESSVSTALSRSFATISLTNGDTTDATASGMGTMTLFGLGALVLIGVLVAAILLTREREDEVERDIYEYCPACDGELEGDEDRCPHCVFNLKKARLQFHDCSECGESIPDLIENCAYCGAWQDVSSFFERREKRERREVQKDIIALPDEDEDEIVTGTEDFADAMKEFGFDEEHLEEEWDVNIVAAEAEVEAAYDRRHADELAMEEMTEEEIEAYKSQVTTNLRTTKELTSDHDIDAFLGEKGSLKAMAEETGELSASDAKIREQLFEITGEEGVLPGQKVKVGMSLTDSSLAGNQVSEAKANFTIGDDDVPLSGSTKSDAELRAEAVANRPVRRRPGRVEAVIAPQETEECGACGADLPLNALECSVCGAKFG